LEARRIDHRRKSDKDLAMIAAHWIRMALRGPSKCLIGRATRNERMWDVGLDFEPVRYG
jgi:hypothetical protein